MTPASRESDERLLVMLRLHEQGVQSAAIGKFMGWSSSCVRGWVSRINRDLAASEDA